MIRVNLDTRSFRKDMNNIIAYSNGYLEGVHAGKKIFLQNIGMNMSEILRKYIDAAARANPAMLHHVYEWYQTGNANARIFDIDYIVTDGGISFDGTLKQSTSIANGSRVPFYDKAKIMEQGLPVTIKPVNRQVLAFENNGEEVFTSKPVTIMNPGGEYTEGGFNKIWNQFFSIYLSQAFMQTTGLSQYLNNPRVYRANIASGKRFGKSVGFNAGIKWIANAGRTVVG